MRRIALDTETTGLNPLDGHRIVEIGCIELDINMPTGKEWHAYVNPERTMPEAAFAVHGLSESFLLKKPIFKDIAQDFIGFINGAELVIHNAEFDIGFINNELKKIKHEVSDIRDICTVFDTLIHARKIFPGQRNNLDALSSRLGISGYDRTHHGALLDAQILAETYLNLTGGQVTFDLAQNSANPDIKEDKSQKTNLQFIKFSSNNTDEIEHNKFKEMMAERKEKEANR